MPLASSNDLILAGVHDIVQALKHPSPGSPLAPLTDSHHEALLQLTSLLTTVASPASPPTPSTSSEPILTAPPTVPSPLPADAPLRVVPVPDDVPLPPPAPTPTTTDAPLRVPSRKNVTFAPLPAPATGATFTNSTGALGKQRRRTRRQSTKPSVAQPAKTFHPNKLKATRVVASHSHGTRSKRLDHVAACARALLFDDARAPQSPFARHEDNCFHFAFHGHAINPDTGKIAEYRELSECSDGAIWKSSNCDEIGRLAQGFGDIKGTNTIFFIHHTAVPTDRKVTYLRVVSALRPEKANPHRVRWTVGGDKVDYPFEVSTKTADLTTAKILINSVVSTPNAKFGTADLKDFYLGTPMDRYEYTRVPIWMLPDAIIDQYDLRPMFHNGYVYVEIRRGMYGLPQAGRLANDQLVAFLRPHGYKPCPLTHGLWRHITRDIVFSLVVDDFGIRYTTRADADHLVTTLQTAYEVSLDWTGS